MALLNPNSIKKATRATGPGGDVKRNSLDGLTEKGIERGRERGGRWARLSELLLDPERESSDPARGQGGAPARLMSLLAGSAPLLSSGIQCVPDRMTYFAGKTITQPK